MLMTIFAIMLYSCFEVVWGIINLDVEAMVSGVFFSAMWLHMLNNLLDDIDQDNEDDDELPQ